MKEMSVETTSIPNSLSKALDEQIHAFRARNPESGKAHDRAAQVMPGGNTRTSLWSDPFPLVIERGDGCRITDVDGHEMVDFLGEFTSGIFGHTAPDLAEAVATAHARGINLSSHNTPEIELAERIAARFPSIDLLRFANSGTEANLMAVTTALIFAGRSKLVVFEGGYHGGVMTISPTAKQSNVRLDYLVLPYDDLAAAQTAFATHGGEIGAVLVEPMLGAGGCHPASREFLEGLRKLATDNGAVLIFDEVQTARMSVGGYQGKSGIVPDMTTIGKFFGGGLAFGAFGGRRDIMARLDPRVPGAIGHAGTFNNNTLTMSSGIVAIDTYLTADALDALYERGEAFRCELRATFSALDLPYSVTGMGSIMNIHGSGPLPVNTALKRLLQFDLAAQGFYFAPRGLIALSLPIGEAETQGFLAAIRDFADRNRRVFDDVPKL